jgi:nicotinic acid phosphoribosyltransferase
VVAQAGDHWSVREGDGRAEGAQEGVLGGFGFSNVDAGRRFGIPVRGTHSHAFVSSFMVRIWLDNCDLDW